MKLVGAYKGKMRISVLLFLGLVCTASVVEGKKYEMLTFYGTSDASAAVAISDGKFMTADDENNLLRVYDIKNPSPAVSTFDLTFFLGTDSEHPEADIEGAARVGNRVYWITSHGRNKEGKLRPSRYRFFATEFEEQGGEIKITPIGSPCKTLLQSMLKEPWADEVKLKQASRLYARNLKGKERKKLAPKREGLNIEGLAASGDGKILYIGFRNPIPYNMQKRGRCAFVVPVLNPEEAVTQNAELEFGKPLLWDLNGLGIRSMEYSHYFKTFFIIAGPHSEQKRFVVYQWSGKAEDEPAAVHTISSDVDFTPEALFSFEGSPNLWLLSDDGSVVVNISSASECVEGEVLENNKCLNKHLRDSQKKTFRAFCQRPEQLSLDMKAKSKENCCEKK
jgi:hypothetical protein